MKNEKIEIGSYRGRKKGVSFALFFILCFIFILAFSSSVYAVDFSCPGGRWVEVGRCSRSAHGYFCSQLDAPTTFDGVRYSTYYCMLCDGFLCECDCGDDFTCTGESFEIPPPSCLAPCVQFLSRPPQTTCAHLYKKYRWVCPSVCADGQTQACSSGSAAGTGECKAGIRTCVNGQWGACEGEVTPADEVCGDSKDNNCNNQTDEGCEKILNYVSGSGQEGEICKTLKEPFIVSANSKDVEINWQVTQTPSGSSGASISQSVTTIEGDDVFSSAYLKLGSLPGSYTTEARCSECTQGSPQTFTANAICPPVTRYSQGDSRWGGKPYDTWCYINNNRNNRKTCQYDTSGKPKSGYTQFTIADLGCALTSMVMVAKRYYSSEPTPDVWNDFMTASGGYTKNADVKWSTLTTVNPDLETGLNIKSKLPLSNSIMDPYLAKCQPVIVKVKNWKKKADGTWTWNFHWVVVTEKSETTYNINDPGYASRTTLSSHKYNNEIYAIQIYQKSNGGCQ